MLAALWMLRTSLLGILPKLLSFFHHEVKLRLLEIFDFVQFWGSVVLIEIGDDLFELRLTRDFEKPGG